MRKLLLVMSLALVLVLSVGFVSAANQNRTNENITTQVIIQNSAPTFTTDVNFDDSDTSDSGVYLDPTPNATETVTCWVIVSDADGATDLNSANGTLYNVSNGASGAADNSFRYFNSSCNINTAYGAVQEANVSCTFNIYWYASSGAWNCQIAVDDSASNSISDVRDTTATLRPLLALDYDSSVPLDFGNLPIGGNTGTTDYTINVYNIGNSVLDLILEPYAVSENDGASMSCTGGTLQPSDLRYSLTAATDYASKTPLSSPSGTSVSNFDLGRQTSGTTPSQFKPVYFGFGIDALETGRSGTCTGTLMITAIQG